eukprot:ANDGO_02774.mRNA.1 mitochondrial Arginine biosynthesis bifunctional protein ArgJ
MLISACLPNYNKPKDTVLREAHGCFVYDTDGRKYLDVYAGICVVNLGHSHPGWSSAVAEQAALCTHVSNYYYSDRELELIAKLRELAAPSVEGARVFLCNSGTEANEAALKFAILHLQSLHAVDCAEISRNNGSDSNCAVINNDDVGGRVIVKSVKKILAMKGGFHGRSVGPLACTYTPAYRDAYADYLNPHVVFWDWNCCEGFEKFLEDNNVGIVITEPIQGEGGVVPVSAPFSALLKACHAKKQFVWIVDEVQTGVGRTGSFLCHQQLGWQPDFVTLAKALGNGFPVGAVLCTGKFEIKPGQHGSTFGGNALAASAASWVVDQMSTGTLMTDVQAKGMWLYDQLRNLQKECPKVVDVRGMGLLIGVQLDESLPVASVLVKLRERGVLAISAGMNTLRVCPPLVISEAEMWQFLRALRDVLELPAVAAVCPSAPAPEFKPIVWKISGDVSDADLHVLAERAVAWQKLGFSVAIVHGAGSQINEELKKHNLPIHYSLGQRVTTPEMLPVIREVAISQQSRIVEKCNSVAASKSATRFVGLQEPQFSGEALGEAHGCVAVPSACHTDGCVAAWKSGSIPVIHFLCVLSGTSHVWNSNADLAISALAIGVKAVGVGYGVAHTRDTSALTEFLGDRKLGSLPLDMWDSFPFEDLTEGCKLKLDQIRNMSRHLPLATRYFLGTHSSLPMSFHDTNVSGIWIQAKAKYTVGLIGSRGLIGTEVLGLFQADAEFDVVRFRAPGSAASSDDATNDIHVLQSWKDVSGYAVDVFVSASPNNVLKTAMPEIPDSVRIVDVSFDHRHQKNWEYAFPYLDQRPLVNHRISNPGCYSTAVICAASVLLKEKKGFDLHVCGISSWSGAGKDYQKKFPELHDTVIPYQPLHHAQQWEMSTKLGVTVNFVPVVTDQFDRGIVCCIQARLANGKWDVDSVKKAYETQYSGHPSVRLFWNRTVTTSDVANTPVVVISGLSISDDGKVLFVQSTIDNLLAGGAYSAYANVRRLVGLNPFPTKDGQLTPVSSVENLSRLQVLQDEVPRTLMPYSSSSCEAYNQFLNSISFPAGFHMATTNVPFFPRELGNGRKKVLQFSCVRMDDACEWAAVYTRNPNCGHPVKIGRDRLRQGSKIRALWINNKISNVGVEEGGRDAEAICTAFAKELGNCLPSEIIPLSTGIIGWRLPADDMILHVPNITRGSSTVMELARAMMTTDTYPKAWAEQLPGGATVVGVAKGAGMIEPNMGTMLGCIMTDAPFSREDLSSMLRQVCDETFNCISIDADTSTSDAVILIASGRKPAVPRDAFKDALQKVCEHLARQVVWNGEGVQHVLEVLVTGAPSRELAVKIGKNVVNSPLVKSAMAGNDPNVGRILAAMGRGVEEADWSSVTVRIGDDTIVDNGNSVSWTTEIEKKVSNYLQKCQIYKKDTHKPQYPVHDNAIVISIALNNGEGSARVHGGDLTQDYVVINSDYRS